MAREIDIKEFAERVERLCDFFLEKARDQTGMAVSVDLKVIDDLKEDAADIQVDRRIMAPLTLKGLDNFMRGMPDQKE